MVSKKKYSASNIYRVKQRKTSTISDEGGLEAREILSVRVQVVETLANICGGRLEFEHLHY